MKYERQVSLERATVNTDTGEFTATLFSDGEASDGHILHIPGGRIPDQMPLFVNHDPDPTRQMGSLFPGKRTAHQIDVRGVIETNGNGGSAEIRRDLLLMMSRGHVARMSGRWDAEESDVIRRVNLPSDHPAFVDADTESGAKRWGVLFRKWTALEGSVVGLGADPQAVLRHIENPELASPVREFWRAVASTPSGGDVSEVLSSLEVQARLAVESGATSQQIIDRLARVFVPVEAELRTGDAKAEIDAEIERDALSGDDEQDDLSRDEREEETTRSEADAVEEVASGEPAPTPEPVEPQREETAEDLQISPDLIRKIQSISPHVSEDLFAELVREQFGGYREEYEERIMSYFKQRLGKVYR